MKKLIDRIDNEIIFYEDETEKAKKYFGVSGSNLNEICENANILNDKNSDFKNRYSIIEF